MTVVLVTPLTRACCSISRINLIFSSIGISLGFSFTDVRVDTALFWIGASVTFSRGTVRLMLAESSSAEVSAELMSVRSSVVTNPHEPPVSARIPALLRRLVAISSIFPLSIMMLVEYPEMVRIS